MVLTEIRSFMHDKITSGALDNAPTAAVAKCDAEQANAQAQKTAAVAALAACTQAKIDMVRVRELASGLASTAACTKSDEANKASAAAASAYSVCAGGERGMLSLLESMAKKYLDATGNEIVTDKVGGAMGVTAALSMVDRLLDILTTEEATVAVMVTADTTTAESLRAGKVAAGALTTPEDDSAEGVVEEEREEEVDDDDELPPPRPVVTVPTLFFDFPFLPMLLGGRTGPPLSVDKR